MVARLRVRPTSPRLQRRCAPKVTREETTAHVNVELEPKLEIDRYDYIVYPPSRRSDLPHPVGHPSRVAVEGFAFERVEALRPGWPAIETNVILQEKYSNLLFDPASYIQEELMEYFSMSLFTVKYTFDRTRMTSLQGIPF